MSSRPDHKINNQITIIRDNEGVYAAEKTYISRPDFVSLSEKGQKEEEVMSRIKI